MAVTVELDEKEFLEALETFKKMEESIDDAYLTSTMRRKAKPIENKMKSDSHSARLPRVIGITSASKKTGDAFLKVGVVKNDRSLFPKISSYGLAAILEYGTEERFRRAKNLGFVTGNISTGSIPKRRYAWLRNSWDTQIDKFEKETIKTLTKRVEKAIN